MLEDWLKIGNSIVFTCPNRNKTKYFSEVVDIRTALEVAWHVIWLRRKVLRSLKSMDVGRRFGSNCFLLFYLYFRAWKFARVIQVGPFPFYGFCHRCIVFIKHKRRRNLVNIILVVKIFRRPWTYKCILIHGRLYFNISFIRFLKPPVLLLSTENA